MLQHARHRIFISYMDPDEVTSLGKIEIAFAGQSNQPQKLEVSITL